MRFVLVRTEPVQEIAAEPNTLAALTAALRTTVPKAKPRRGQLGRLDGIDLVADPALSPGTVHLRPRRTATS